MTVYEDKDKTMVILINFLWHYHYYYTSVSLNFLMMNSHENKKNDKVFDYCLCIHFQQNNIKL